MAVDLDSVRKKLKDLKDKEGAGDFMDLEQGENVVRFLSDEDGEFYRETGFHYIRGGSKTEVVTCLQMESQDDCYVCDLVASLRKSKDQDDRKLANDLRSKPRIFFNVLDRKDGNRVKVLATGNQIFKALLGFFADEDWGDLTDPKSGHDVVITKTGKDLNTDYTVMPKPKPTKMGVDGPELIDLDELVQVMDYDEQKAFLEGDSEPVEKGKTERKAKGKKKEKDPVEEKLEKLQEMAEDDPKLAKALKRLVKKDFDEDDLDELLELFSEEEEPEEETKGSEEEDKDEIDGEIDKALEKFRKKKEK